MRRITEHPILTFKQGKGIKFTFDGKPIEGQEGDTIASALQAAGVRVFRESINLHRPRGFFCAIGRCANCSMVVDGVPNTKVCVTRLREGMTVETQHGRGRLDNRL
jgi:predicted molibdopterin-dependent oxidoreductase YjgC